MRTRSRGLVCWLPMKVCDLTPVPLSFFVESSHSTVHFESLSEDEVLYRDPRALGGIEGGWESERQGKEWTRHEWRRVSVCFSEEWHKWPPLLLMNTLERLLTVQRDELVRSLSLGGSRGDVGGGSILKVWIEIDWIELRLGMRIDHLRIEQFWIRCFGKG